MRIGIDIDGVLINMERFKLDFVPKFCYENNINYAIDSSKAHIEDIFKISEDDNEKFWNLYLEYYVKEYPLRDFAKEVIDKLKEKNEIYIVTARNEKGLPPELYGTMREMTQKWINENNIKYDKLIFEKDKLAVCMENDIDLFIEDSPEKIYAISSKIPTIVFDAAYNREVEGKNITRAYSWYDVFNIIERNGINYHDKI